MAFFVYLQALTDRKKNPNILLSMRKAWNRMLEKSHILFLFNHNFDQNVHHFAVNSILR